MRHFAKVVCLSLNSANTAKHVPAVHLLALRTEQCDEMEIGKTVELRNAKITMHNNHMRLAIDRWGLINTETTRQVSDSIPETNFSDTEYELQDQ